MRRCFLTLVWIALSITAITIAWAGVAVVDDNLAGSQHNVVPRVGDNLDSGPSGDNAAGPEPRFAALGPASPLLSHTAPELEPGTTDSAAPAELLAVETLGGSASFHVSDGFVAVRWASPHPGYGLRMPDAPDANSLTIVFESDDHLSRIEVDVVDAGLVHRAEEVDLP